MSTTPGNVELLSPHTRAHIDHWVAKFPPGKQRSAVLEALRAAQEQNRGHLSVELMASTTHRSCCAASPPAS